MIYLIRISVLAVLGFAGYVIGAGYGLQLQGLGLGLGLGLLCNVLEFPLRRLSFGAIVGGIVGLALGLATSTLILHPLRPILTEHFGIATFALGALLGYSGFILGLGKGDRITPSSLYRALRGKDAEEYLKILDTSVIIDGRIADICESGFIDGVFVVPQFILQELQHIADSPDTLKRARGRRGLDILHRIQKMASITVRITDEDFPKIKEVDAKLVALANSLGAKIITNDVNLNKVAELQGVSVLNINELANAIKPVVLPGESVRVFIIKEGKESNQGVAYLDDGTMVVVDNGRKLIGKTVDVTVTSVLQTTAGRMIFAKTREDYEREELRAVR